MATNPYVLYVGELGGENDQIQRSVTTMSVSLTADMSSEIKFTVTDPGFKMHNAGYFVMRRPIAYEHIGSGRWYEISSVQPSGNATESDKVEIFARSTPVQKMKRDKGAANFGKISPSSFASNKAKEFGLEIFAEGSPAKAAIVRQNTENSQESTWDVLQRLAGELDFICFETGGILFFASEEFIVSKQESVVIRYPSAESDNFFVYDFTLHRSDDEVLGADLDVSLDRTNATQLRPGMSVKFEGLDYFDEKAMMITSVDWDVVASNDRGLGDAVISPVKVKARTLENQEDLGCEQKTFKRGSKGDCVKRLQQAVNAAGFSPGSIDGIYGPLTEAAVARFQESKGLDSDGICGSATWAEFPGGDASTAAAAAATPTGCATMLLRYGSRGNCVKTLQTKLNAAGFNAGTVDGIFGSGTKAAVKSFQSSKGLVVDGIVGPKTWGALG